MLFLLRPRQTWMPYALPRPPEQQAAWNAQLQQAYASTRVVEPAPPRDTVADLKDLDQLHKTGTLSDDEFALAKAKILGS
jgi:hypothetical protein